MNKTNLFKYSISFIVWAIWLCVAFLTEEWIAALLELVVLLLFPLIYTLYNVFKAENAGDFFAFNIIFSGVQLFWHYIASIVYYSLQGITNANVYTVVSFIYILILTLVLCGIRAICDKSKHKIIAIVSVFLVFAILCIGIVFWLNPNLNYFEIKKVENNAREYIVNTYPDFVIDDITVNHEWKSNTYVVDYNDGNGDNRTVIFDHTGEDIFIDEYIHWKAFGIISEYKTEIELKITEALKNELQIDTYYVIIDDENTDGREREIALEGLDISNDPITCSIGFNGKNRSSADFAKLSKEIYMVVSSLDFAADKIEIIQHISDATRFDIDCPDNMADLTVEEIEALIKK